jgi:hypothetical protein
MIHKIWLHMMAAFSCLFERRTVKLEPHSINGL